MIQKDSDLTYKIGISMTPGVNADVARALESHGIELKDFFELPMSALLEIIPNVRLQNVDRQEALFRARNEESFARRHNIRCIYYTDDEYPILLREIQDAPVMLYVLGNADLNASPAVAMVGTRKCTAYGMGFCESFVNDFAPYYPEAAVVSGLAFGIDAAAHTAALKNNIKTFAVLAHGLDTIYPSQHRDLARNILNKGGALISEYPTGTRPFRANFLHRNRIVAALSEATIVVESEIKGGAMSTANLAFNYNREVYALPGRVSDRASEGTNLLIAQNKAKIFTSLADMMAEMRWPLAGCHNIVPPVKNLFPELDGDARTIYQCLHQKNVPMAIDELHKSTALPISTLLAILTELEFDGVVVRLPGARYEAR
ncbi:MAG: DNA-protecting protein DprA [Bacteroidales bacterium]|nr:DNA-protecting protein DprA [Bacteroidales bacterium]